MRELVVDGARLMVPDVCPRGCGSVATDAEAIGYFREWGRLDRTCSFCALRIRIVTTEPMEHLHRGDGPPHFHPAESAKWVFQRVEHQPHFSWFGSGPWGSTDINAHEECARSACPHAKWGAEHSVASAARALGNLVEGRVIERGSLDDITPVIEVQPCKKCGREEPGEQDVAAILQWARECLTHKCAYCGLPIKVEWLRLRHYTMTGEHGFWCARDWRRQPSHHWCAYAQSPMDIHGHLPCARAALKYAEWRSPVLSSR